MAATFGRFHTDAGAHGMTKVPSAFHLSLDVRAYAPAVPADVEARFLAAIGDVEARRGVRVALGTCAAVDVGEVAPGILAGFESAAGTLGIATRRLGSPASHDAAAFAKAGVPMAMLFVRDADGSHNPDEAMEIDDLMRAVAILTAWLVAETC